MMKNQLTVLFLLVLGFSLCFSLLSREVALGTRLGEDCSYGLDCQYSNSLNDFFASIINFEETIIIHVFGSAIITAPIIVRNPVVFAAAYKGDTCGDINYPFPTIKKEETNGTTLPYIEFLSSVTFDSMIVNVPIIISGKSLSGIKASLPLDEKNGVSKLSDDYKCYAGALGNYDYYNKEVVIQNSIFRFNELRSPFITLGKDDGKTFLDKITIQNTTFDGLEAYSPFAPPIFTDTLFENPINAINITGKTLVNKLTLDCNRFYGVSIMNRGLLISTEETNNLWYPQLYEEKWGEKVFLPSILNVQSVSDAPGHQNKTIISKFLKKVCKVCKKNKFFDAINKYPIHEYAILRTPVTMRNSSQQSQPKVICLLCNQSAISYSFGNQLSCDIVVTSFDVMQREFSKDSDKSKSQQALSKCKIEIEHHDTLQIDGRCKCCQYQQAFRTILGPAVIDSSCSEKSDFVFKFNVNGSDPSEVKTITVSGLTFVGTSYLDQNRFRSQGGALQFESVESKCDAPNSNCLSVNVLDNRFIGFEDAIYMHLNQKCSAIQVNSSIFELNSNALKYYQNENDEAAVETESCATTIPSFVFSNNQVSFGGGVFLSGEDWVDSLSTTPLEHKGRKTIHKGHSSHNNETSHHSSNSKRQMGSETLDSRALNNRKKNLESIQLMLQPQYLYSIVDNLFYTSSEVFLCHSLSGIIFDSNQVISGSNEKTLLVGSDCVDVLMSRNNFTNTQTSLDNSLAVIDLSGSGQSVSDNIFNGRISIITNPSPLDQKFHLTDSGIGNFLFFRNVISKDTVLVIPDSDREKGRSESEFFSSFTIRDICETACPQLTDECWDKLATDGDFFSEYKRFRHPNNECSLSLSAPDSIVCHQCLFQVVAKNDSAAFGTKIILADNHLSSEKCDLSNFVFDRENSYQCKSVTSENVFFTSLYVSSNCPNTYEKVSELDGSSLSLVLDAKSKKSYLDAEGILRKCKHGKVRSDSSNHPDCCVEKKKKDDDHSHQGSKHHHEEDDDDDDDEERNNGNNSSDEYRRQASKMNKIPKIEEPKKMKNTATQGSQEAKKMEAEIKEKMEIVVPNAGQADKLEKMSEAIAIDAKNNDKKAPEIDTSNNVLSEIESILKNTMKKVLGKNVFDEEARRNEKSSSSLPDQKNDNTIQQQQQQQQQEKMTNPLPIVKTIPEEKESPSLIEEKIIKPSVEKSEEKKESAEQTIPKKDEKTPSNTQNTVKNLNNDSLRESWMQKIKGHFDINAEMKRIENTKHKVDLLAKFKKHN